MLRLFLVGVGIWLSVVPAFAGQERPAVTAEQLKAEWDVAFAAVRTAHGRTGVSVRLEGTLEEKTAIYRETIERLIANPRLRSLFEPDPQLVEERTREAELAWIAKLSRSDLGEKGAKSVNGTSTNPAAPKVAERSGFTDLVALALDNQNFVAANKTAVSINLNAIALFGLNDDTRSAPAAYRRHRALRRLGGTFTFGAKALEKEITGLTGTPSADTLFDVFAWDTKVRVIGDRDPRARQWDPFTLGWLGGIANFSPRILEFVPADDRVLVAALLNDWLGTEIASVRARLSRSWQVSVKVAGQHLTNESGKDKYSVAVLGDKGFGDTDFTFNLLYSAANDVTVVPGSVATVKTWSTTVGLNSLVAKNLLVQGRATELSLNANLDLPADDAAILVDRKTVWRVVGAVSLPWGASAKIPVSITYTNDPNNLTKDKFVTGHIGISYDFGALGSLFKPQTNGQ